MIRATLIAIPLLALAYGVAAAQADLRTRAERTGFVETSRYADVVGFLDALSRTSRDFHLLDFGYSFEGRALPLVVWSPGGDPPRPIETPDAIRNAAGDRLRVFVFANIHAGEVAGKEAVLILLRELAEGKHTAWADSMLLMVAPNYNADGNERVTLTNRPTQHGPIGGMGQRPNAQGLDLNRDFMKLEAPESRSLVRLIRQADPHVIVDLHTTDGTFHGYHLTYSPPLHPDTDPVIDGFLRDSLLPAVTRAMRETSGYEAWHYGNLPEDEEMEAPRGWYTFSPEPRFSTNYVGLRNRFGVLSEVYSHLPFDERVEVTRRFVEAILDFVAGHGGEIRRRVEEADRRALPGSELAIETDYARTVDSAEIVLGDVEREPHPFTGEPMLKRLEATRVETMPAFISFRARATETAPAAYLVPAGLADVLEILDAHGVPTRTLGDPVRLAVEEFRITASRQEEREFQGHRERILEGSWAAAPREVPAGMVVVPMESPLARLAFHLLEPRASDGLAHWNVLDPALEDAAVYPILRTRERVP